MNKRIVHGLVLVGVLSSHSSEATSYLQSPLHYYRGTVHYPLPPVKEDEWIAEFFAHGYNRCADQAYVSDGCSKSTKSLASIFFCKDCFRGADAFTNSTVLVPDNPFIGFAQLSPRFSYNEKGAFLSLNVHKRLEDSKWRLGFRTTLPFKVIDVERRAPDRCECPFEENLSNVIAQRIENVNPNLDDFDGRSNFAYRLDFLSSLAFPQVMSSFIPQQLPLVQFGDAASPTIIAQTIVSADPNSASLALQLPQVALLKSSAGTVPPVQFFSIQMDNPNFGDRNKPVTGPLNGAGTNGMDNDRLFFEVGNDYKAGLANNKAAQSQLWVTPIVSVAALPTTGGSLLAPLQRSQQIEQAIHVILDQIMLTNPTAESFFCNCGITFKSQRVVGLGDLDFEFLAAYDFSERGFIDVFAGLRFPTGVKQKDCGQLLFQPTGNNGHFEFRLGLEGGGKPAEWFGLKADMWYSHVFKAKENRGAAFKGATVCNIGPCVCADVSWNYFVAHIDATFFHPINTNMGMTLGYELYVKGKDKVCFKVAAITDCAGRTNQPLDSSILTCFTNRISHKIRGEFFHRWDYFEFVLGGSHVVAGKNAMKETEGYIGVGVSF